MATSVVSGRVDDAVRARADAVIRAAGFSVADVIRVVWENIARTGVVPVVEDTAQNTPVTDPWDEFMAFRSALPESPWLVTLSDQEMKDVIASRYE